MLLDLAANVCEKEKKLLFLALYYFSFLMIAVTLKLAVSKSFETVSLATLIWGIMTRNGAIAVAHSPITLAGNISDTVDMSLAFFLQ